MTGTDTSSSASGLRRAFVVGCRRSGTTWTMMLTAQHPEAVALQQTDVMRRLFHFTRWFEQDHPYGRCILTPGDAYASKRAANGLARISLSEALDSDRLYELARPLADEVFARAAATNPQARLVVEQTPEHIHAAGDILRIYPDALFVNVIRDPRAVFSSHRGSDRGWAKPSFFSSDPLDVSREWKRAVEQGLAIADLTDRYLELRYEALIEDGVGELARLYSFLGLQSDEELCTRSLEACRIERMRQADHAPRGFFRKGQAESWREELDAGELRAIEYLCGDLMADLGYPLTQDAPVSAPLRLKLRALRTDMRERLRDAGEGEGLASRFLEISSPGRTAPQARAHSSGAAALLSSLAAPLVKELYTRSMAESDEPNIRDFWNEAASLNHYVAICDGPDFHDPNRRDEAFQEAGERDAFLLSWFTTPEMTALDLGCGAGRVVLPMAGVCRRVIGVDVSDEMLARARAYVGDTPNVAFQRSDGASLEALEDASVDFAYSLLCLIHIDKKSAFRYLRELSRVLRPGGMAHLQFQTLADPVGTRKFVEGLDQNMPLEFYGPDELPFFLEAAGLSLIGMHRAGEYCFATVINGSGEDWIRQHQHDFTIDELETSGFFDGPADVSQGASLRARLVSRSARDRTFLATLRFQADGVRLGIEAPVVAGAGATSELRVTYDGEAGSLRLLWNGSEPARFRRTGKVSSTSVTRATLDAGLLPPAQPWNTETLQRFPGLLLSRELSASRAS